MKGLQDEAFTGRWSLVAKLQQQQQQQIYVVVEGRAVMKQARLCMRERVGDACKRAVLKVLGVCCPIVSCFGARK